MYCRSLEFITLKDNIYSSCQCYAEHAHFSPPPGVDDKKQTDSVLDSFDYFLEKDKEKVDDLHKSYNDRSYLSSEEVGSEESRTGEYQEAPQHDEPSSARPTLSPPADFVAVLTGVTDSWLPTSSGVARARFSLSKTSLAFSITYQR